AAIIVVLVLFGRWLESRARSRSGQALRRLLELGTGTAMVLRAGAEAAVPGGTRPGPLRPGPAPPAGAGHGHGHGVARRGRGGGAGRGGGGRRPVRGPARPGAGHRRGGGAR